MRVLEAFGASVDQDRVYRFLVTVPSAAPDEVAAALGLDREVARTALRALVDTGLVHRNGGRPARFAAEAPDLVVEELMRARQAELTEARVQLADTVAAYRAAVASQPTSDLVEIVPMDEHFKARLQGLLAGAREDLRGTVVPPYHVLSPEESAEHPITVTGIARVIYDRSLLEWPRWRSIVDPRTWENDELRVHDGVPLKMLIIDRSMALISSRDEEPRTTVIVRPNALLAALLAMFDWLWERATPLPSPHRADADAGLLGERDQHVLALLLAGFTDESIATQLGLGLRSVQRIVRSLMDLAGVRTRLQLGWHAARHGWMDERTP